MRTSWRALVLLTALNAAHVAAQQAHYCSAPDTAGVVSCQITGPLQGSFTFPLGVQTFNLDYMSSGNGGTYSDYLGTNYPGGKGVEAIGGGQLYAVPPNGRLDFYVGANGNDYFYAYSSAPADPYASPEVVKAPPFGGDAVCAGTGGGPTQLTLASATGSPLRFSLGAGGGSGSSAYGGSAGSSNSNTASSTVSNTGTWYAGAAGTSASGTNERSSTSGGGGPANSDRGGTGGQSSFPYEDAQGQGGFTNGPGGDGAYQNFCHGGGGGSFSGSGGGAVDNGAGGGGNSFVSAPVANDFVFRLRTDSITPVIKFSYNAFAGADTTVISSVTAVSVTTSSTQLPAVMATIVANEISTTLTSSTTQYPLSSQTTTIETTTTLLSTRRRTKGLVAAQTTVTPATFTETILSTSTATPTCITYEALFPAGCCPAMWRSLTPIATATQQRRDKRVVEFFEKRNDDAAPTLVTTGVGQPASVVVSTISTGTTTTRTLSASTSSVTVTSYTATQTSTVLGYKAADTTTLTTRTVVSVTEAAQYAATYTVVSTFEAATPGTTVTVTTSVPAATCALQNRYSVSACPTGIDRTFERQALAELVQLKNQSNGRPVRVNCGSYGSFDF